MIVRRTSANANETTAATEAASLTVKIPLYSPTKMIAINSIAGAARLTATNFSCREERAETGAMAGFQCTTTAVAITLATMVMSAGITAAMNTSKI